MARRPVYSLSEGLHTKPVSTRVDKPTVKIISVNNPTRLVTFEDPQDDPDLASDAFARIKPPEGLPQDETLSKSNVEALERICRTCGRYGQVLRPIPNSNRFVGYRESVSIVFFDPGNRRCRQCIALLHRDRRDSKKPKGIIYFAEIQTAERYIKLGHTKNFEKRYPGGYATDSPYRLKVLLLVRGHRSEEQELHRYLSQQSLLRSEWYYPTTTILDVISSLRGSTSLQDVLENFRSMYGRYVPRKK